MIDKILRQESANYDVPFGGLLVFLVGNFQQFPPVGDATIYSGEYLLFQYIKKIFYYKKVTNKQEKVRRISFDFITFSTRKRG